MTVPRANRVTVIGGGVIGLTCALELAGAGHRVTVLTADPVEATTSAVAAALWLPYRAAPASTLSWAVPATWWR
jgi:D-amino-acid oxidase